MLTDTHCHLDYLQRAEVPEGLPPDYYQPEQVLARAQQAGVTALVNPGVSLSHLADVIALADRFENVYAACAIHPTDVAETLAIPDWQAQFEAALRHPKVVAIGETGLDYYHDTSHKALQQQCFEYFLDLGRRTGKPVIVHDREAHDDILAIVRNFPGVRVIMHCFSGDADFALAMIGLGAYISFAGNLTFKKAEALQQAAGAIPVERLLVETDTPFLSPMPHRGKTNEPARVVHVAEKIATLKGLELDALVDQLADNCRQAIGNLNVCGSV